MNFKFKSFSLLLAAAAMGFTACNNDDLLEGNNESQYDDGTYFHVKVGLSLPTGTRSATDDDEYDPDKGSSNSDADAEIEQGLADENEIRTLYLVYADKNDNYITHSVVQGITKAPVSGSLYDYEVKAEIAHENLEQAYNDGVLKDYKQEDDIHVYALCNYTGLLEQKFKTEAGPDLGTKWIDWVGEVVEESSPVGHTPIIDNTIWAKRSFLMTNYQVAKVKFPESIDDWDEYTDPSTPWILNADGDQDEKNVGAIRVEHVAARFDFKDASDSKQRDPKDETKKLSNTYDLLLHPNSYNDQVNGDEKDSGDLNIVSIKLTRMALVNMSKHFYYLPRVSADGLNTNSTLCGFEKTNNFVVDSDAGDKNTGAINASNASTYFNFPLYTTDGKDYNRAGWYVDNIDDILGNGNKDGWNTDPGKGAFNIWRYVTENTIPGAKNQITGQSTGIVFKGKLLPGVDIEEAEADKYVSQALIDAFANVETDKGNAVRLYSFENRLFAGPEDIIAGAYQDGENSALYFAVKKVLENWKSADGKKYTYKGDGNTVLTPKVANAIIQKKEGYETGYSIEDLSNANPRYFDNNFYESNSPQDTQISVYQAENYDDDGWGYYCFFFYWNRHNDNNKAGLMGNMEFATVRNNVYKLSVTKINRLGHPTQPGDDPDPEEFEDPDEPPTNYIQVQVDVLPWVVRENKIQF